MIISAPAKRQDGRTLKHTGKDEDDGEKDEKNQGVDSQTQNREDFFAVLLLYCGDSQNCTDYVCEYS